MSCTSPNFNVCLTAVSDVKIGVFTVPNTPSTPDKSTTNTALIEVFRLVFALVKSFFYTSHEGVGPTKIPNLDPDPNPEATTHAARFG